MKIVVDGINDIINKIKNGEIEIGIYTARNENNEDEVILCLSENDIIIYTLQDNGWIRINQYDGDGKMIGESYER